MTNYLFESSLIIFLSYLLYKLLLKGEKAFQFNRFYLLTCLLLSLCVPFIEYESQTINKLIEPLSEKKATSEFENQHKSANESTVSIRAEDSRTEDSFESCMYIIYFTGLIFMLFRFFKNVHHLVLLIKSSEKLSQDMKVVLLNRPSETFSFFHYLFIDGSSNFTSSNTITEIEHEKIHSREWHSIDVIITELCLIIFWFNPFLWFIRKEISENHEYIADREVARKTTDIKTYSNQIIQSSQKGSFNILGSGFSFIHLKNRIDMLHQKKSNPIKVTIKLFSAALLITVVCFISSFKTTTSSEPFVVIIDAGHGGDDYGASYENINEKDINLRISKILQKINIDPELQLSYLREDDKTISLQERLEWVNSQNAVFYLSLHTNNVPTHKSKKGMEVYFSNKPINEKDSLEKYLPIIQFTKGLANQLESEIAIKPASFFMLNGVNCPGAILEMGFLSNNEDRKTLSTKHSQEKIAKAIYEAISELKLTWKSKKE